MAGGSGKLSRCPALEQLAKAILALSCRRPGYDRQSSNNQFSRRRAHRC